MRSVRKAVAALLVGGACITGVTACGGSDTIADKSFLTRCKKTVDRNASLKAYSVDICACTQKKLKAQGLGKKSPDAKSVEDETTVATRDCLKQVVGGA
jgi:hypothetical protein